MVILMNTISTCLWVGPRWDIDTPDILQLWVELLWTRSGSFPFLPIAATHLPTGTNRKPKTLSFLRELVADYL